MRHAVIGTAGHVDHGKTALVYALTQVQTDRLPEEQRRGITIELGFAPWRIRHDLLVSIIDAPGHRKLVHNMIAGASGIDIVMLVVAADEGVMPQTREHMAACELLGVKRAVVAVTKVDRADEELAELAGEEAAELLAERGIEAEVVVCSAKTGQGIDDVRAAVLRAIDAIGDVRRDRRVRLGVDRAFTVHGSGTVVTGTLVEGELRVGQSLRILSPDSERSATARGLHVHGEARSVAQAPTRLAINLGGVSLEDVQRGDVITNDPAVRPTRILDAWLQTSEILRRGAAGTLFIGTSRSVARIQPLDPATLDPGGGGAAGLEGGVLARLRLDTPIVTFGGDRYVLRGAKVDGPAGAVFGGGVVLDAHPPRTVRAAKRAALLAALHRSDPRAVMRGLVAEHDPRPAPRASLPARFCVAAPDLEQAAEELAAEGELVPVDGEGWLSAEGLERLKARAAGLVAAHHQTAPLDPGLKLQTLREQLSAVAGEAATALALQQLAESALVIEGNTVRLASFSGVQADSKAAAALGRASELLGEAALAGLSEHKLGEDGGFDAKLTRALCAAMERGGAAVRCGPLWFDAAALEALVAKIRGHFQAHDKLTIADFKDLTGLGRKQAIPLLEHLDRTNVTKRERDGSDRVRGSEA